MGIGIFCKMRPSRGAARCDRPSIEKKRRGYGKMIPAEAPVN